MSLCPACPLQRAFRETRRAMTGSGSGVEKNSFLEQSPSYRVFLNRVREELMTTTRKSRMTRSKPRDARISKSENKAGEPARATRVVREKAAMTAKEKPARASETRARGKAKPARAGSRPAQAKDARAKAVEDRIAGAARRGRRTGAGPLKLDATQIDAARAYQMFLPDAMALPADQVLPYRLDINVAPLNVRTGLEVLVSHDAEILRHLPRINREHLRTLAALSAAVKFAAVEAEQVPSESNKAEAIAEAWQLRGVLLSAVSALAAAGLVPRQKVDAIRRGRGPRDMAEDCVALAHLLRESGPALAGKHPVPAETIERAAAVGTRLLQELRKDGAPAEKAAMSPAVDIRNRMATLLVQRHERLQAVAFYFHGASYEEHAPPLNSRRASRRAGDKPAPQAGGDSPQ